GETGRNYDTSLSRALSAPSERGDNPAPCAHVLLRRAHAMEHVANVAHHGGAFFGGIEEAGLVELAFEMLEQGEQLGARCRSRIGEGNPLLGRPVEFGDA